MNQMKLRYTPYHYHQMEIKFYDASSVDMPHGDVGHDFKDRNYCILARQRLPKQQCHQFEKKLEEVNA